MLKLSHIVNSVFTSRTYILSMEGCRDVWLVDCGDVSPILDYISTLDGMAHTVKGVMLTHAHYDHIYGLPRLKELFPDVKVYTNEAGHSALMNERMNMSKYHDDPIHYDEPGVTICDEGSEISLYNGVSAKVYATPGHHPSCLCFEVENLLFTGDAWIPGIKVVTTLPGGNKAQADLSLERIKKIADGKMICAGHEA